MSLESDIAELDSRLTVVEDTLDANAPIISGLVEFNNNTINVDLLVLRDRIKLLEKDLDTQEIRAAYWLGAPSDPEVQIANNKYVFRKFIDNTGDINDALILSFTPAQAITLKQIVIAYHPDPQGNVLTFRVSRDWPAVDTFNFSSPSSTDYYAVWAGSYVFNGGEAFNLHMLDGYLTQIRNVVASIYFT